MAKIDILATWMSCKSLIKQAKTYANSGYNKNKNASDKIVDIFKSNTKDESSDHLSSSTVPPEILSALKEEFKKIIDFIEIFLMQDPAGAFYGLILCEFEYEICFSQQGVLDLDIKTTPYKIKYNPLWAEDFSINELIGSTINEIVKFIYLHPATFASINPFNDEKKHMDLESGSSVSSSELVLRDITLNSTKNRVKLHNDIYRLSDLEDEISVNRSVKRQETLEYYYKIAEAYRKTDDQKISSKMNLSGQSASGSSGNSSTENPNPSGVSTPENKKSQGSPVHSWESTKDPEQLKDNMKQMIKTAYDNLNNDQRGYLPSDMIAHIEKLFKKPELNWKDILRKYIGNIPSGHRPSRLRLNRRQPYRFDLSGQLSNKVVKLVIAIDTSGSMSDHDIAYCMNEIYNIVKDYKTDITVIECDAQIGKIYSVKSPKDIQTNVTGRGGTEFTPVIEYINSHRYRDAVMIYFTDGYGESRIDRPRTYRNLWVIRGNEPHISLDNPYGEVKCLRGDADYNRYR